MAGFTLPMAKDNISRTNQYTTQAVDPFDAMVLAGLDPLADLWGAVRAKQDAVPVRSLKGARHLSLDAPRRIP